MGENERTEERTLAEVLEAGFERFQSEGVDTPGMTEPTAGAEDGNTAQQNTEGSGGESTETGATGESSAPSVLDSVAPAPAAEPKVPAEPTQEELLRAQNQQLSGQVQQLTGQVQQLVAALQQSQAAVGQQSQLAEEAANQNTGITLPRLDFRNLQYQSDEEAQAALGAWGQALMDAARQQMAAEMKGDLDAVKSDYQRRTRDAEIAAAKEHIYGDERFPDFRERDADIENVIARIPELAGMDAHRARMLGGLIDRGIRSDPRRTMTADELVAAVEANPDAMKKLEIRRAQEIQQKNENLPRLSASQGMTGASPVPEHEPKTFTDMMKTAGRRLGLDI